MIKIIDDWYITVETSPINYVVRKGNGERREKKGWSDDARGYFSSLRGAVKYIREQIHRGKTFKGLHPASRRDSDYLRGRRTLRKTHGKDWSMTTHRREDI